MKKFTFQICLTKTKIKNKNTAEGAGAYNITYIAPVVGEYNVHIKLNNQSHVIGSPFVVTVIPGSVSAAQTTVVSGSGHVSGTSNEEQYFIVQTKDGSGNNLTSNMGTFSRSTISCLTVNNSVTCSYLSMCHFSTFSLYF